MVIIERYLVFITLNHFWTTK